jgi:ribose transport system substrate-binding protein
MGPRKNLLDYFETIRITDPPDSIIAQIMDLVSAGILKIGDHIPPEEELQHVFNTRPAHIRRALTRLTDDGVLRADGDNSLIVVNTEKRLQSGLPSRKNYSWVQFDAPIIKAKGYRVGFSQPFLDHPARRYMHARFTAYARRLGVDSVVRSADWSLAQERRNITGLGTVRLDGIIISTLSGRDVEDAVFSAAREDVPMLVFASGNPIEGWPFDIWASTNEWQQGRRAGYVLGTLIGGAGDIAHIQGAEDSSVARRRRDGIMSALDDFPDIRVVAEATTDWQREPSSRAARIIVKEHPDIRAVIAHCDEQAIGVARTLREMGRHQGREKIFLFSVSDCQIEAFDLIRRGELMLTQNYEQNGAIALNLMLQLLEEKNPPRLINLGTSLVTKDTVDRHTPNF